MEAIIKSFLGMFFIMLMLAFTTEILAVQLNVVKARQYHASAIALIENSNFNAGVVNECVEKAYEMGYEMEVKLYHEGREFTVAGYNKKAQDTQDVYLAAVELKFSYGLEFSKEKLTHELIGYAQ